jgi:hypothetical protein
MGTTAGVLLALGVSRGVAVNFALAAGLMLTGAALAAAALGLGGSLLLSFRRREPLASVIPASRSSSRRELSNGSKTRPDHACMNTGGRR